MQHDVVTKGVKTKSIMDHREAGDWILEREIGSGSFAKVWRATHKRTQQVAAVKEINLDKLNKLNKKLQESLASEVQVLNHIKHHNIVCLLDLIRDNNRLFIVLEFCAGGDLGHYIKRYRQVSEATARYFLQQLAEGLKELRRHNVIHRDLKPQNLLLSDSSSTPLLKIADFGFARPLAPQGLAETLCGSPLYMAPEILQFHKYDAKADLWSIGTILYELLVGKPPFNGANHMQLLRNIERGEARLPEALAGRLSAPCKGLLQRLLQRNPVERITFEEFFQHPFLSGHTGPSAGVPPSQPIAATVPAAPGAVLPAAMRQAAAAVAAAAAADPAHKASGVGLPRPSLHLHAGPGDAAQHQAYSSNAYTMQPQQQQYQQLLQSPAQRQCQQQAPAVVMLPPQLQVTQQQQQQQQQQQAGLVSRPVSNHPLAAQPAQRDCELELMSDSMEGDFVVVYNPAGSSAHKNSSSNNSSKASSGLVDPKAAAVLQGTAGTPGHRMPWPGSAAAEAEPAVQQAQQGYAVGPEVPSTWPAGGLHHHHHHQQQQQQEQEHFLLPAAGVPGGSMAAAPAAGAAAAAADHPSWPWAGASTVVPETSSPKSMALQQPTAAQRAQLLVQVVRGCVCLLGRQECGANDTTSHAMQLSEQLALMLLALQLVQAVCLPQSIEQAQQQESADQQQDSEQHMKEHDAEGGLSAVLAAASQSDLEQLMSGAVELLRLAKSLPGLASSQGENEGLSHHHTVGSFAGGAAGGGATGIGCMGESLLQMPLPDPFAVLYHQALDSCRGAAVEEVMGNWQASVAGYSLAADLLLFLSYDWPQLGAADPGLPTDERGALHKLYAAVNGRLAAVVAEAPSAVMY